MHDDEGAIYLMYKTDQLDNNKLFNAQLIMKLMIKVDIGEKCP